MGRLLRTLGVVVALVAIGLGIYIQTDLGSFADSGSLRAEYVLGAMNTMTVGLLLAGFGHFLVLRESSGSTRT
jgi:hypothetical protein